MFYPKDSYSHPVQLDLLFRQVRSSPFLPPAGSFLLGSVGLRTALLISPTPIHKVSRATHASDESRFWAYVHGCNPSTQKVEEGGSGVLIQGPVQKQNKTNKTVTLSSQGLEANLSLSGYIWKPRPGESRKD